jgi:hypothetical protein
MYLLNLEFVGIKMIELTEICVYILDMDKPVVHGKSYRVVSSLNNTVLFKITVDGNPPPSLACRREGEPRHVSIVRQVAGSKSTFFVNITATDDEKYYCDVSNVARNRRIQLQLYKRSKSMITSYRAIW